MKPVRNASISSMIMMTILVVVGGRVLGLESTMNSSCIQPKQVLGFTLPSSFISKTETGANNPPHLLRLYNIDDGNNQAIEEYHHTPHHNARMSENDQHTKRIKQKKVSTNNNNNNNNTNHNRRNRRSLFSQSSIAITAALTSNFLPSSSSFSSFLNPPPANAIMTQESEWPLWTALPVAPYNRRRTIRYKIGPGVYAFDQLIGIYYVHVPIRMTVLAVHQHNEQGQQKGEANIQTKINNSNRRGLVVYAPIAPTRECLELMSDLIDQYGPVRDIILPSVAVEHKVNAGPFARAYPHANFYVTDQQYAFPINLPNSFLGFPSWTKILPRSSSSSSSGFNEDDLWGGELEHEVLTVKPGIGSMYQDVGLYHKSSKTMVLCDTIFAVNGDPPKILTEEEEYTRALLFHARDTKDEIVEDTIENRRKGWRRIVLLFNFFFPGSGRGDLGPKPILEALKTPGYTDGWGGWKPFTWGNDEILDFNTFSANGKPTVLPIIQIILSRNAQELERWLDVITKWNFQQVVPMHLDAPLNITSSDVVDAFLFLPAKKNDARNFVRFCDEDVEFLRKAEEGPLNFSVYKTSLGTLRGEPCGIQRPQK